MKKMKSTLLIIASSCALTTMIYAQTPPKPVDPSKEIVNAVNNLPTTDRADRVEIYQQSSFRGKVAKYAGDIPSFTYPFQFTNKRGISLKVAPGYIAYIAFNEDNSQEGIFIGDHPNFGSENPNDIKSIRIVPATTAYINFIGFSTQIHNNDCRRIFGTLKIRFLERMPSGVLIPCPRTEERGSVLRDNRGIYTAATMFDKRNEFPERSVFGTIANVLMSVSRGPSADKYILNFDGTTPPRLLFTLVLPNGLSAGYGYRVSETALREDRIVVEFETNLGDQHKSNDLATDYSSNVSMQETVKTQLNYQSAPSAFSIGNFELKGKPDNNYGMASGVKFSIIKTLRVHFNKEVTAPPRR